jgi:hypothetical protein
MMFDVGDFVKMNEDFVEWCENQYQKSNNSNLETWLNWANEVLEVISVELNSYDRNYTDVRVRPQHSDHSGLIVSIGNINMKLFASEMVPFSLTNGTRYSDDDDDCCKKCGAPGRVTGMACVCSKCGEIIWGI